MIARRDGTAGGCAVGDGRVRFRQLLSHVWTAAPAGRLLMDADDAQGAPMTAVMGYEAWQRDYAGDASVVGSTFWINTKPVTVVGIAPEGFYGDRISSNSAWISTCRSSRCRCWRTRHIVHDPRIRLALHDWAGKAGRGDGSAAGKGQLSCASRSH